VLLKILNFRAIDFKDIVKKNAEVQHKRLSKAAKNQTEKVAPIDFSSHKI